jgi:hypothetical protein
VASGFSIAPRRPSTVFQIYHTCQLTVPVWSRCHGHGHALGNLPRGGHQCHPHRIVAGTRITITTVALQFPEGCKGFTSSTGSCKIRETLLYEVEIVVLDTCGLSDSLPVPPHTMAASAVGISSRLHVYQPRLNVCTVQDDGKTRRSLAVPS